MWRGAAANTLAGPFFPESASTSAEEHNAKPFYAVMGPTLQPPSLPKEGSSLLCKAQRHSHFTSVAKPCGEPRQLGFKAFVLSP